MARPLQAKKSFASKILDVVLVYSKTDYLFTSTKRKEVGG